MRVGLFNCKLLTDYKHLELYLGEGNGTPLQYPGKSHGWRSLVGCRLWGRIESDTTAMT